MSTTPSSPSPTPRGFAATALERKLDEWSLGIREATDPGEFLRGWLTLAVHTARADSAVVWLKSADHHWSRLELSLDSAEGRPQHQVVDQPPEDVLRALSAASPVVLRGKLADEAVVRGLCRVQQGGTPVGVLEAAWPADFYETARETLQPFLGASAELLGDFLVRHELHHLRDERAVARQWERFQETVLAQPTFRDLAQHIVHDGRLLTGAERICIVRCHGSHVEVIAVSGVDLIDPRSSTVQSWEHLARQCAAQPDLVPLGRLALDVEPLQSAVERVQHTTNAVGIAVVPVVSVQSELLAVIVGEWFDETPRDDWDARFQRLQRIATAPCVALCQAEQSWWSNGWGQLTRSWRRHRTRTSWILGMVALSCALLALTPARLVVTAEGIMLPAQRRNVFAGTSGIVTEVNVEHGESVTPGQVLASLRDPTADLEATRISGELATVRARLNVVQAARISATGEGANALVESQQLAGEEAELKLRLESLLEQQQLLNDERQATRVTSPIAGNVLTWDVQALLAGRPVQRGQILLTIGDVAGPWIVEAHVRERDIPELYWGRTKDSGTLTARFFPVAGDGRTYTGKVVDIARVTDVNERGETTVRVILAFDGAPGDQLRPGATVLPRIDCGTRPLGYVWLREPFHVIRRQWWLWW